MVDTATRPHRRHLRPGPDADAVRALILDTLLAACTPS
jgi:hypothetical protein